MMNVFFSIIGCILIPTFITYAQTVKVENLPTSVEEFIKLRDKHAVTPEGGATMFLVALKVYTLNKEIGKQCLVIAADRGSIREGNTYKGFSLLNSDLQLIESQIGKEAHIPNSYIVGASPAKAYKVMLPYYYQFTKDISSGDPKSGKVKLFVKCFGADGPRTITMIQNDKGIWKASQWSSILVGVQKPAVSDDL
jgi:hypothetical protein